MSPEEKKPVSQYNVEGKELEAFLCPLEASVIGTIWCSQKKPVTVREIREVLQKRKPIAYTTVMNAMDRLYEKGLLDRNLEKGKGGVYFVYWPKLDEQKFKETAVRKVLNSLMDNFGSIVTGCLIENAADNKEQLLALKEQLEKALKEKK